MKRQHTFINQTGLFALYRNARLGKIVSILAVGALLAVGMGGCKKETTEQTEEPPSLPNSVEQEKAMVPDASPDKSPEHPSQGQPAPEMEMPSGDDEGNTVSQSEIESFVQIQKKIAPLHQQLSQQAQAGASQEQMQQQQVQMQQRVIEIIESSTLSPERLNEIETIIQRDPNLMRQVQTEMQKDDSKAVQPSMP